MNKGDVARETNRVREDWTRRGRHWDRQADNVAEMADRFNQPLLDAAAIAAGQTVIDLATGAGEPALTVAERVGPRGSVLATDLVPDMMEGAKRRATERGLGNIEFRVADMCSLQDADDTFDRATCRFGLMFVPEPERAVREVGRVLKPGGRAAFLVWGPRSDITMFTVFAEAAEKLWGGDDPLINFEDMCRLGDAGSLAGVLGAGGLIDVEERELRFAPRVPADPEPWRAQVEMSFGPKLDTVGPDERTELENVIRDIFSRHLVDGKYHMTAHVRIGTGDKPR